MNEKNWVVRLKSDPPYFFGGRYWAGDRYRDIEHAALCTYEEASRDNSIILEAVLYESALHEERLGRNKI